MKKISIFFITILTFSMPALAKKPEASLYKCQSWKDDIKHYTDLRRRGGRAKIMEDWKRARTKLENKFRAYECDGWGKKLK
ncbi:hypothetical protein [Endozoicomonas sp. ALC020]|uniref:hypothetical protein n=1 Tax=unclassified Endozoicomonas TaxID=2644528 RepID=UPI003BAEA3E0